MIPAEALVLGLAMILSVVLFLEVATGTLSLRVGELLLTLAMLAAVAALLHMLARWW